MKALKYIREGKRVVLPETGELEYYIRGKAKDGRVQLLCYHAKNHERYSHLDKSMPKDALVDFWKPYWIQDWAGNRLFPDKRFETFDDDWAFIFENVVEEVEGDGTYDDYYVLCLADLP